MRRLVIETATAALSLALYEDDALIAAFDEVIGRGHAERLIPEIARLPDGGRANEIWVDSGPGSFTGVRIGIAAAKGLAIAWSAKVQSFPCHALVAASFAADHGDDAACDILIAMDGGHGEWLVAPVENGISAAAMQSLSPERAASFDAPVVIGSRAEDLVALRASGTAYSLFPSARHAHLLDVRLVYDTVVPVYARAPDATPMQPSAR